MCANGLLAPLRCLSLQVRKNLKASVVYLSEDVLLILAPAELIFASSIWRRIGNSSSCHLRGALQKGMVKIQHYEKLLGRHLSPNDDIFKNTLKV